MEPNDIFGINDEGRTAGLCSYCLVLGWVVSRFGYHQAERTSLGSYHLRQTLLLYIAYVTLRYGLLFVLGVIGFSNTIFSSMYFIVFVNSIFGVLWLIGLNAALNGEERPIPIFGVLAQTLFSSI